jgi:hypothetical protein
MYWRTPGILCLSLDIEVKCHGAGDPGTTLFENPTFYLFAGEGKEGFRLLS